MAKTPDANAPAGKTSTTAEEENRDGKRAAAPGEKTKGTLDFFDPACLFAHHFN